MFTAVIVPKQYAFFLMVIVVYKQGTAFGSGEGRMIGNGLLEE
jgi:hypothetical protein